MTDRLSSSEQFSSREDDYPVTYKTDAEAVRQENAHLRARLRNLQDECNRWARRWAALGLGRCSS